MIGQDGMRAAVALPECPRRIIPSQRLRSLLWSPEGESLTGKAASAATWTLINFAASFVLRLGSNLVLTRLLFPEAFGLMSLVGVFMAGLQMFTDLGVGQGIIQNQRGGDPAFLNTAWTIQVGRGTLLWLASALIAWPVARFYGESSLTWLLPVAGLTAFIQGFSTTAFVTANKQLRLGRRTLLELLANGSGVATMVTLALVWRQVWVLLAGGIVSSLARVVLGLLLLPNARNHFHWDAEASRSLFAFGRWIFANTLLAFIGLQADRLILGKLLSIELLGVYSVGVTLVATGRDVLGQLSANVIFPAVALRSDLSRTEIRDRVAKRRRLLLALVGLALGQLVTFGDVVVMGLYDKRYVDASWILPILALGAWPLALYATSEGALFAIGKPSYITMGSAMRLATMCVGIPLGFHFWGFPGVVAVVAMLDCPRYVGACIGLVREKMPFIKQDLLATGAYIGAVSFVLLLRFAAGRGTPIDHLFGAVR